MPKYDPTALGSDVPRSVRQYIFRALSKAIIRMFGLNRATTLATEFVQMLQPVIEVRTDHGPLLCRGGHGRLLWRARSFHDEEPETIKWLDTLDKNDVLWDIGANVGMYSLYAAKFRGCRVFAFEPEAQNFALLVENIALNGVGERCIPAAIALCGSNGYGYLSVRYITKGGAYNHFGLAQQRNNETGTDVYIPRSVENPDRARPVVRQLVLGRTLDDLATGDEVSPPTHLKIDVDGLEPEIIDGAKAVLSDPWLESILIEINRNSPRDMAIPDILTAHGFKFVSERSNWLYRRDRSRENEVPTTNMIFSRR
ncbi:MAG: FkbM family methyltransferase [Pseudomonadota bacterium]